MPKVWTNVRNFQCCRILLICTFFQINPTKTCESVCQELASRVNMQPHLLCLEEVICNESLRRPLHYKERLFDCVLRWSYWDEVDRKNNYLLLTPNNIVREILPLVINFLQNSQISIYVVVSYNRLVVISCMYL